jgi:hypothetical protein
LRVIRWWARFHLPAVGEGYLLCSHVFTDLLAAAQTADDHGWFGKQHADSAVVCAVAHNAPPSATANTPGAYTGPDRHSG